MKHLIPGLLLSLGLVSTASASDACQHQAERDLDLDAGGIRTLELLAGAGRLDIRGESGLERIVIRGRACASDADLLAGIGLTEQRRGETRTVTAEMSGATSSWFGDSYQRLDLEVRVPARFALDVADSSGGARLQGVASAVVQDSSGDLTIHDIAGDLTVRDSSGDIDIRGVGGRLHIPLDSSGDIEAVDIGGDAVIDRDSSGSIVLREVRGDARVDHDSSGDIRFVDIDGSALVGTDSSGSIVAERIGRDFTVQRDGSGGIRHRDVGGRVELPSR